jgi:hypothetical protein
VTLSERLAPLLREPLVHFLVAGFLLFLVLGGTGNGNADRSITVDEAQIEQLSANWSQTWQRPPTAAELDRLIDNHVREEIYYREALRLGLEQNDTVIRRRLRSKMEFLARAAIESAAPSDAVLQAWLDDHPERYAQDRRYSFEQLYLGPDSDGETILRALRAGGEPGEHGLTIALPQSLDNADRSEILRLFGARFAESLDQLAIGEWQGPVASGFGNHLVRLSARDEGTTPQLADVRQRIENDWRAATAAEREELAYQALRDGYSVQVEGRR